MVLKSSIVNSEKPLFLTEPQVPFVRLGRGHYKIGRIEGVVGFEPPWGRFATPQGYGYYISSKTYLFRRVDGIWVRIDDIDLRKAIDYAVRRYTNGEPITFDELNVRSNCPPHKLAVAYSSGILGDRTFPEIKEPHKIYIIRDGWLSRISDFNSYYRGLALFEKAGKPLYHVATYWWNSAVFLVAEESPDGTLSWEGGYVEDEWVVSYAKSFDGKTVLEIARKGTLEDLRVLSCLIGVRLLEIDREENSPKKVENFEFS